MAGLQLLSLRDLWRLVVTSLEGRTVESWSEANGPSKQIQTSEKPTEPWTPLTRKRALKSRLQPNELPPSRPAIKRT
jgi:hypothetical protein